MIYSQSRYQNIFNRIYENLTGLMWGVLIMVIASIILNVQIVDLKLYAIFTFSIPVVITFWLIICNSGSSKMIEYGFKLDDQGVTFIKYGEEECIRWVNYDGYKITRFLPKYIEIKNSQGSNIIISFYTFSLEQRNVLFETLNSKHR